MPIAAAAPPTCHAPCHTPVSSRSWSRSVTTTKFHGCQFLADGASLPASSTFARSSSLTGADENSRTLRRDLNASQVSTEITLRPACAPCPEEPGLTPRDVGTDEFGPTDRSEQ